MHCAANPAGPFQPGAAQRGGLTAWAMHRRLGAAVGRTAGACCPGLRRVRAAEPELTSFELTRDEEGLLPEHTNVRARACRNSVDEALSKAVPLFFVAEAEVFRNRFYWRDQRVAYAVRRWRIVFHSRSRRPTGSRSTAG